MKSCFLFFRNRRCCIKDLQKFQGQRSISLTDMLSYGLNWLLHLSKTSSERLEDGVDTSLTIWGRLVAAIPLKLIVIHCCRKQDMLQLRLSENWHGWHFSSPHVFPNMPFLILLKVDGDQSQQSILKKKWSSKSTVIFLWTS